MRIRLHMISICVLVTLETPKLKRDFRSRNIIVSTRH